MIYFHKKLEVPGVVAVVRGSYARLGIDDLRAHLSRADPFNPAAIFVLFSMLSCFFFVPFANTKPYTRTLLETELGIMSARLAVMHRGRSGCLRAHVQGSVFRGARILLRKSRCLG